MIRTVAMLLGVLLLAAPAGAQTSRLDPPDLERFLRWGPLRVRPGFQVTNFGYDDNIFFSSAEGTESDFLATFTPSVDGVVMLGSRGFVTFEGKAGYTVYKDNTDLNYLDHEEQVRLTVPVRSIGVFAGLEYRDDQLRPADREDVRANREQLAHEVGLIFHPGWRSDVEIARRVDDFEYRDRDFLDADAPISQRLNRRETGTRARVTYRAAGRLDLLADGLRRDIAFDDDVFQAPNGDLLPRDTREWRARAGVAFGEDGALSGRLLAGWGRIDAEDPLLIDFSELIGEAELTYRFNRYAWVRLDASRLPGFAVTEGNAFLLNTRYELRAVRFLNRFIGLEAALGDGTLNFPASFSGFERRDDISTYDAGVRLRLAETGLGRQVEYRIRYQSYDRSSNAAFANQSRDSIGVTAVFGY